MKKYLIICTIILIFGIFSYNNIYIIRDNLNTYKEDGINQISRTNEDNIEIYKNGKWEKIFLKGVNIGAAKPGYFPGEFGITKEDYKRWFKYIQDMNANVIRVYTLQTPQFYEAIYEYNKKNIKPIYVIHGVWVDEHKMSEEMNAFSKNVIDEFKDEIKMVIDALHGNASIEKKIGRGHGKYKRDISKYVIGYILGIEWEPYFVNETNKKNKGMEDFKGNYIYTENANPIEIFLANCGDEAIKHETSKYKMQKPIAFSNWVTTDIIDHKDEIEEENRIVNIDENKIKETKAFKSGLFISYHIYPYYPDFLNYDEKYTKYIDEKGEKNPYKAYLNDLKSYYGSRPIIVSEFGVPTSRGITHKDLSRGFNQGMMNEIEQGIANKSMLEDIYSSGYAGAIVFSWQDEWFKRTWNTMDIDDPESRAYWPDKMTNEQFFGILSFESGKRKSEVYIDGKMNDWKKKDIVSENNNSKLYVKSDEGYLYIGINKKDLDLSKEEILIPIDVTPKSGSKSIQGFDAKFNKEADFVINIKGENNSKILVNEYYDIDKFLFDNKISNDKNTDKFNIIKQTTLGESKTPISNVIIPKEEVEVGNLIYGNSNPKSKDYNSLADFIINKDNIEIRIPWLMLNISNPVDKLAIDDFNKYKEVKHFEIDYINIGLNLLKDEKLEDNLYMKRYTWDKWDEPIYHERLKKSYYIMKDSFGEIN